MSLDMQWFNIPVCDINRAVFFYSWLFDMELKVIETDNIKYAYIINGEDQKIGLLLEDKAFIPDKFGILLHFYIKKEKFLQIKKFYNFSEENKNYIYNIIGLPKFRSCTIIEDSEGNRISICYNDCN